MNIRVLTMSVKAEGVEAFKSASFDHLQKGSQETGVVCFELVQQNDQPNRFLLLEAYNDDAARDHHFHTSNYRDWSEKIARYLDGPIESHNYHAVYPLEKEWK